MPLPVKTLEPQDICKGNYTDPVDPNRHCAIGWIRAFSDLTKPDTRYYRVLNELLITIRQKDHLSGIAIWNDTTSAADVVDTLNTILTPYKGEIL